VIKKHAAAHPSLQQKMTAKQVVSVPAGPSVAAATRVNAVNTEVLPVKGGQAFMLRGPGPFHAAYSEHTVRDQAELRYPSILGSVASVQVLGNMPCYSSFDVTLTDCEN